MEGLQKPLGAYLVGIAVVVAVWFIINTLHSSSMSSKSRTFGTF